MIHFFVTSHYPNSVFEIYTFVYVLNTAIFRIIVVQLHLSKCRFLRYYVVFGKKIGETYVCTYYRSVISGVV